MNTAALVVAAGLPMYDSVPAAMFRVGAVSTARRIISSFEKAGGADIYLVGDEQCRKLERQLSSTSAMFLRCEAVPLEAAKQAIVSLPKHYDKLLLCSCDRPLVRPMSLEKLLCSNADITVLSHKGLECPFFLLSMQAAERLCADTASKSFSEALSNLGFEKKLLELDDPGLCLPPDLAALDRAALEEHQNTLTRPLLDMEIYGQQSILEPRLIKLLRLVNSLHSVRNACEMLGISYSIAWNLLNASEAELGCPLLRRNQGGRSGPGTDLTEDGRKLLSAYDGFEAAMKQKMQELFSVYFSDIL